MKQSWGKVLAGYTIVEVIIFLAISGAILVASLGIFAGREERVRYTQSVDELENKLRDIFNDTATGFFPSNSDFSCTSTGTNISLSNSGNIDQGSNTGCVFAGKFINFRPNGVSGYLGPKYDVYTLVGSANADSIHSSQIKALGQGDGFDNPGIKDQLEIGQNILIKDVLSNPGVIDTGNKKYVNSLVVASSFDGQDDIVTGSGNNNRVKLYIYDGPFGSDNGIVKSDDTNLIPVTDKVIICLNQDGDGRESALTITKQLAIVRDIDKQPDECRTGV